MPSIAKTCFHCGREFEPAHALANICAPGCRPLRLEKSPQPPEACSVTARPAERKPDVERGAGPAGNPPVIRAHSTGLGPGAARAVCLRCGKSMPADESGRKFCSVRCRKSMHKRNRKGAIRRVYVEPVSLAVLRQRDGDTCRICGEPVNGSVQAPHPAAATIDHVVALARGGEHSYRNTQLAHHRCNTAKGSN